MESTKVLHFHGGGAKAFNLVTNFGAWPPRTTSVTGDLGPRGQS